MLNNIDQQNAKTAVDTLLNNLRNPITIEGNEKFLNQLVNGVTVTINREDVTVRFINFDDIWKNSLIVTNQYAVQQVRADICLLVNGIPLVPIEAKQCARRGTNWLEGVRQFQTYDRRSEKLFMCHLFGVACNGRLSKYGIPGASASYFNEWKDSVIAYNIAHLAIIAKSYYFYIYTYAKSYYICSINTAKSYYDKY